MTLIPPASFDRLEPLRRAIAILRDEAGDGIAPADFAWARTVLADPRWIGVKVAMFVGLDQPVPIVTGRIVKPDRAWPDRGPGAVLMDSHVEDNSIFGFEVAYRTSLDRACQDLNIRGITVS